VETRFGEGFEWPRAGGDVYGLMWGDGVYNSKIKTRLGGTNPGEGRARAQQYRVYRSVADTEGRGAT